ncbi:MAG TPA: polysaccharide deacetylase family protein [Opitutaceae bacterium]|nr:polysaccharide deacetylase family protein [Opitutaceae bacterium]
MKPRHWIAALTLAAATLMQAEILSASPQPPGGLAVADVPQFVMFGFDDNPDIDAMEWFTGFLESRSNPASAGDASRFDGAPVRAAFYSNGKYFATNPGLAEIHLAAFRAGHEIANHTENHEHGRPFTLEKWRTEIEACTATFVAAGIPAESIRGFRTPFLEHNPATFVALEALGFTYDTTLEEGEEPDQDGRSHVWPYTLHDGSPGNARWAKQTGAPAVGSHPSLWEVPIHVLMIPSDADCERYGVKPGLRARVGAALKIGYGGGSGEPADRITGLDWNVLEAAKCEGPEFLAILKHTLDLRLEGNRAPFMIGGHTALYPSSNLARRRAIEEFVDYALSKSEVRFVTPIQLVEWMRSTAAKAK